MNLFYHLIIISSLKKIVWSNGDRMRINEQIKGKEVVDSSGMVLGKVKDVELNWDDNSIESIVLGSGGISESLGLSKDEKVIPYDMVKHIGDKILLKEGIYEPKSEPKSETEESEDNKFQDSLDKIKNRIDIR